MNNINFDNPWLLFLALPLLVLVAVPFFVAVKKDNKNWHNVLSLVLHVVMVILIAFSAAGTTIKSDLTQTHVYVVCDLSQSTANKLDEIDYQIDNLQLPSNSKMGVVCFANNAVVTTPLGKSHTSVKNALSNTQLDRSGTNIVSALNYTRRLFADNVIKRIVLITDAKQTDESDSNALYRTAQALNQENIYIDAIFLNSTIDESTPEVQVQSVETSSHVYLNQKAIASVVLQSNVSTNATLKLVSFDDDATTLYTQPVSVSLGATSINFTLDTSQAGEHSYHVVLDYVEDDTNALNNSMSFTQTVEISPRALLITGDSSTANADRAALESYFQKKNVTHVTQEQAPLTIAELCNYDEIVLSNVDVAKLSSPTIFVSNLTKVVANLGKSLLVFGELSHSGGYEDAYNQLTKILPLGYGNDSHQGVLYTIVFDLSTSMRNSNKLVDAKQALRSYIGLLNDNDSILFYTFNNQLDNVISIAISGENREEVYAEIDKLDGTSLDHDTHIWEFLLQIQNKLDTSYQNYQDRQIILVSDLVDRATSPDDYESVASETINELAKSDIYTNIIYMSNNSSESDEVQTALSNAISRIDALPSCSLYCWPSDDETSALDTWKQNIADVKINRYINVNIALRSDEVMSGVTDSTSTSLEFLGGFMRTYARPSATTVLTVEYESKALPLYAYRNYINGKVAVFASSLSGSWLVGWQDEDENGQSIASKFFNNVFATNVPSECIRQLFRTELDLSTTGSCTVNLTPADINASSNPSVTITNPNGESVTYSSIEFDASHYSFTFATQIEGAYKIDIQYNDSSQIYSFVYNLSYLPEYDSFTIYDAVPLIKMLSTNGQVITNGQPLSITNDEKVVGSQTIYLADAMLILAVCLFVVDIINRKIRWRDIKSLLNSLKRGGKA